MTEWVIPTNRARCRDCCRCVRACPIKAVRVRNGQAQIVPELCVACASCVRACPQSAKVVRDDRLALRRTIAERRTVVASAAPSAPAYFGIGVLSPIEGAIDAALTFAGSEEWLEAEGTTIPLDGRPNEPAPRSDAARRKGTPPVAHLTGVDLVTEGNVTLGQALQLLEETGAVHDLPDDDGTATWLARILLSADDIHLLVGTAINPNQVADVIRGETRRMVYTRAGTRTRAPQPLAGPRSRGSASSPCWPSPLARWWPVP